MMKTIHSKVLITLCVIITIQTTVNSQDSCQLADIGFVVDTSESIQRDNVNNFASVQNFLKQFVNSVSIGSDAVQIGLVNYGSTAQVEFTLGDYSTAQQINQAIDNVQVKLGKTDTTSALEALNNDIFSSGNGERSTSPNIGILMTDGRANVRANELAATANLLKNRG